MKFDIRKAPWVCALAFAIMVFGAPKFVSAYSGQDQDQNAASTNNALYQQGLSHGQDDGANSRPHQYRLHPDNDADRHAYEAGYDQGYQNNSRSGANRGEERDANGNYIGQNGPSGPGGYAADGNVAAQNGFQDGTSDGLHDRQAGHSSRATKHESWEHGDRGYSSSFGSKDQFKATYRSAYIQGYQQGYNGQGFQSNTPGDRDANGNLIGQSGQYGQSGPNGNLAAQNGFQDGSSDGLHDRQSGHSSRATEHESWEHGDRGYSSSFGSKEQYKASYREAYIRGYEQGYNAQGPK